MTTEAFKFEPAFEAPCKDCGDPVIVSTAALEACKRSNHILQRLGETLLRRADIALCRPCYDKHHGLLWAQERVNSEAYERMWGHFRKAWRSAPDDKRDMLEKKLRQGMGEYWDSYKALLTGWKAEQATRRGRSKEVQQDKAGF